jgi:hypothetical protein
LPRGAAAAVFEARFVGDSGWDPIRDRKGAVRVSSGGRSAERQIFDNLVGRKQVIRLL